MKDVFTDYRGNVIEFDGSREDALQSGLNVNCTNCTNCTYCTDCTRCTDCTYCTVCTRCTRCTDCTCCDIQPVCISTEEWIICVRSCKPSIKIGCQDHSVHDWMSFADDHVDAMHPEALAFWKKWKPVIQAVIASRNN